MAAGILALDLHMNLSSSTPRRLHRDDVERPRGNRRGGSVRVLRGGVWTGSRRPRMARAPMACLTSSSLSPSLRRWAARKGGRLPVHCRRAPGNRSAECHRPRLLAAGCELEAGPWSGRASSGCWAATLTQLPCTVRVL